MKTTRTSWILVLAGTLTLGAAACAIEEDETESAEGEIRGPKASEIVGTLAMGQTASFDYTYSTTKRYRAYRVVLSKGDSIVLRATASAGGDPSGEGVQAAPMLWLTSAATSDLQGAPLAADINARGTDRAEVRFTAPNAMTIYALFREKSLARAKFSVDLSRATATNDPFDPASCSGPMITAGRAAELLGPGGTWKSMPAGTWLTRSRRCNAVTGCTPFSTPQPQILQYEDSDERHRTFIDAPVTLAPNLAVIAGAVRLGVKGIASPADLNTSRDARFFNADLSDTQSFEFKKTGLGIEGNSPYLVSITKTYTAPAVHMVMTDSCARVWQTSRTPELEREWAQVWRF